MMNLFTRTTGLVALTALVACGPDIEGDWESAERIGSRTNEMTIESDGTGNAKIWFVVTLEGESYLLSADFKLSWESAGSGFELDMRCRRTDVGSCGNELDFTMDCDLKGDDDVLECDGDKLWREYEFEWERK